MNSRPLPKHNKSNTQQTISQYQTKWRDTWSNPSKIGVKTRLPTPYLFNIVFEVLARSIRKQKEINGIQTGKEGAKVSAGDMVVYIRDPKKIYQRTSTDNEKL